jgi:hypothetical protein
MKYSRPSTGMNSNCTAPDAAAKAAKFAFTLGLTEGDRVVVSGHYKLRQNAKVIPHFTSTGRRKASAGAMNVLSSLISPSKASTRHGDPARGGIGVIANPSTSRSRPTPCSESTLPRLPLRAIAAGLNARGIRTPRGVGGWKAGTVSQLLARL